MYRYTKIMSIRKGPVITNRFFFFYIKFFKQTSDYEPPHTLSPADTVIYINFVCV